MKVLKKVTADEVIEVLTKSHSNRHVVDLLRGNECGHRKYGCCYGTYNMVNDYWNLKIFGKWFTYVSFFGFLKRCDMCGKQMIKWPSWKPPIIMEDVKEEFRDNVKQNINNY